MGSYYKHTKTKKNKFIDLASCIFQLFALELNIHKNNIQTSKGNKP